MEYRDINRYEMKASYQKNMLVAQLIAIVLIVVPVCLIAFFSSSDSTQTVRVKIRNIHADPSAFTPPDAKPTKRNIGGKPAEMQAFHGQFGIKIRIIPDSPSPVIASKPKSVPVHTTQELAPVVDSNISVSDLDEGPPGAYVPGDADYAFDQVDTTPQEPNVVPCSVLVAVKPEYPYVARDMGKEGAAGLIVCIDEQGRVSLFPDDIIRQFEEKKIPVEKMTVKVDGDKITFNYVVTVEEPKDFFFAKKVAEILPKWVFAPSTVDGQRVKSLIPIGHAFCLTGDCHEEYAVLRNYKQYAR